MKYHKEYLSPALEVVEIQPVNLLTSSTEHDVLDDFLQELQDDESQIIDNSSSIL